MSGEDIKTKVCSKCGKELPMTDEYFYKKGNKYQSPCKECTRKQAKEYYETHKDKALERLNKYNKAHYKLLRKKRKHIKDEFLAKWRKPCQKCGEQRLYLIQFHHIDPTTKEFDICEGVKHKNIKTCEEEVKNACAYALTATMNFIIFMV